MTLLHTPPSPFVKFVLRVIEISWAHFQNMLTLLLRVSFFVISRGKLIRLVSSNLPILMPRRAFEAFPLIQVIFFS